MKNDLFYSAKQIVKNWWISLLIGVVAILLGVWSLANPGATLALLATLFITGFFISGIFSIFFALSNKDTLKVWGWHST